MHVVCLHGRAPRSTGIGIMRTPFAQPWRLAVTRAGGRRQESHVGFSHAGTGVCAAGAAEDEEDADGWDVVERCSPWGLAALASSGGGAGGASCGPGGGAARLAGSGPLPFLPPPPSRPADVLQYERALFTDAHGGEAGGGAPGGGLALLAAGAGGAAGFLRPAALAAEQLPARLRQHLHSWARRA